MIVFDAFRGSRGHTRIALVDDDALYREAVAAELEDRGYRSTCLPMARLC